MLSPPSYIFPLTTPLSSIPFHRLNTLAPTRTRFQTRLTQSDPESQLWEPRATLTWVAASARSVSTTIHLPPLSATATATDLANSPPLLPKPAAVSSSLAPPRIPMTSSFNSSTISNPPPSTIRNKPPWKSDYSLRTSHGIASTSGIRRHRNSQPLPLQREQGVDSFLGSD